MGQHEVVMNERELRMYRDYTVQKVVDNEHQAVLKIGNQSFDVGPLYPTHEEARWLRKMLGKALAKL